MNWNKQQHKAIYDDDCNILVAAGAGSGKTAVLTQRILRLLEEHPELDITNFAVLTFTNKAAGEMRERIAKGLSAAPGQRRQLDLLPLASISTIHGFCKQIIDENFEVLSLPAKMKIMDPMLIASLKDQALDYALEELFQSEAFRRFAAKLAPNEDAPLREMILGVMALAARKEKGHEDIRQINQTYLSGDLSMLRTQVEQGAKSKLRYVKARYDQFDVGLLEGSEKAQKQRLLEMANLNKALELLELDRLEQILPYLTFGRKERCSNQANEQLKPLREEAKALCEQVGELIVLLQEAECDDFADNALLLEAAACYREHYQKIKLAQRLMDFDDMERFAYEILQDEQAAREYRARYAYVFIDEYQDTSELQEAILRRVSREDNLFMVGDYKQSIYGFRSADPTIFLDKYHGYAAAGKDRRIELNVNYRSSKNILDFVNDVMSVLMNQGQKNYPKDAFLTPGQSEDGAPVEICLLEKQETDSRVTDAEKEAAFIAQKMRELQAQGYAYGDMAILLRKTNGEPYQKMLERYGIPVELSQENGGLDDVELGVFVCLLELVDNRQNDIPLVTVLYSSFVGLDLDALIAIREELKQNKQATYFERILCYMQTHADSTAQKLGDLFAMIDEFKLKSRQMSIEQLLAIMLEKTGYIDFLGTLPGGDEKIGHMQQLLQFAKTYQSQQRQGLGKFLEFLKSSELHFGSQPSSGEAVHVMTIHKSKGLEFPVVFVAGMDYLLKHDYNSDTLLTHSRFGIGLHYYSPQISAKAQTLLREVITQSKQQEDIDEELRLLYVALTRAKQKLYLTGKTKKALPTGSLTRNDLAGGRMLHLIVQALEYYPAVSNFSIQQVDQVELPGLLPASKKKMRPQNDPAIDEILSGKELEQRLQVITKKSVSEMTKGEQSAEPVFSSDTAGEDARRRGTLVHHILSLRQKGEGIEDLLRRLHTGQYFSEKDRELIDQKVHQMLERYWKSALRVRMEEAERLYQEKPFVLVLSAQEDGEPEDTLVQGIIDVLFWEQEGYVLVDYKTDYIKAGIEQEVRRRYSRQLELYAKAVTRLTGQPVKEKIIYLLRSGQEIKI